MPAAIALRRTITPAIIPMTTSNEMKAKAVRSKQNRHFFFRPFLKNRFAVVPFKSFISVSFSNGIMEVVDKLVVDD